jgi:hypothetical protein
VSFRLPILLPILHVVLPPEGDTLQVETIEFWDTVSATSMLVMSLDGPDFDILSKILDFM